MSPSGGSQHAVYLQLQLFEIHIVHSSNRIGSRSVPHVKGSLGEESIAVQRSSFQGANLKVCNHRLSNLET